MTTSTLKHHLPGRALASAFALSVAIALNLCLTGCQSFKDGSPPGTLTSVTITSRSNAQIGQAVQTVFVSHGFQGGQSGPNEYTYERPGSREDNIEYGDQMFGDKVTIRVVVTVQPVDAVSTFVNCNAWYVEAADDPVLEDQHKVRRIRKEPYKQLLQEIRAQLEE